MIEFSVYCNFVCSLFPRLSWCFMLFFFVRRYITSFLSVRLLDRYKKTKNNKKSKTYYLTTPELLKLTRETNKTDAHNPSVTCVGQQWKLFSRSKLFFRFTNSSKARKYYRHLIVFQLTCLRRRFPRSVTFVHIQFAVLSLIDLSKQKFGRVVENFLYDVVK